MRPNNGGKKATIGLNRPGACGGVSAITNTIAFSKPQKVYKSLRLCQKCRNQQIFFWAIDQKMRSSSPFTNFALQPDLIIPMLIECSAGEVLCALQEGRAEGEEHEPPGKISLSVEPTFPGSHTYDVLFIIEAAVSSDAFLPAAKHAGQGIIKCQLEEEEVWYINLSQTFAPT